LALPNEITGELKVDKYKALQDGSVYVEGVVSLPLAVDSQGDVFTPDDVRKLKKSFDEIPVENIDIMHDQTPSGAVAVRSFLAMKSDPDGYPEGSWVLGVTVSSEVSAIVDAVKSGNLSGFSAHFICQKVPAQVTADIARIAMGDTELSTSDNIEAHNHSFVAQFDSSGRMTSGYTTKDSDHAHPISGTGKTDEVLDHAHRIFIE